MNKKFHAAFLIGFSQYEVVNLSTFLSVFYRQETIFLRALFQRARG